MDKDVAEPVGSGYPGVIQSAPQMGSSLNNPDIARTHTDITSTNDQTVSQPERLAQDEWQKKMGLIEWDKIPDVDALTLGDTATTSLGGTDCPVRSRPADVAPAVSANNAGTPGGHSGGLGQASAVGPPIDKTIHSSCPTLVPDKALDATVETVEAKTQFRKEDIGPPLAYMGPLLKKIVFSTLIQWI